MRKKKLFIMLAVVIIFLAIIVIVVHRQKSNKPKKSIAQVALVEVQPVKIMYLPTTVTAVGTLIAPERTNVSSETNGYVRNISFKSGQHVNKGDVLLNLDNVKARSDVLSAKAAFYAAKTKYARALKLQKKGFIAKQDVDSIYSDMQNKLALRQEAEDTLNKKTIRAPFDGYLGKRTINVGDYIQAGQKLVELVNRAQLKAEYSLPEQYLSQIKLDQKIEVTIASMPKKVFCGKVSYIAPAIDDQTHTVALRATVPNSNNILAPGLFVTIRQILDQAKPVISIPEQSLIKTFDTTTVFKVVNNQAKAVAVKVGNLKDGYVEILSGLSKGDVVITVGQNKIKDGDKVKLTK
jgi:membrane fusion protein (multidrug efflux system)